MTEQEKNAQKAEKELAQEVLADFRRRQEERRGLERGWQLNMNFLSGNQYCDVNASGEIEEEGRDYFWQTRRVFNYIAPTVDTRCAKLARVRPRLAVRAASNEDCDLQSAKIASAVLNAAYEDCNVDGAITAATVWSETCGTAFYKVFWDGGAGSEVGRLDGGAVNQGDVKIVPVSPFELYPYSLSEESVENQPSIIQAKAVPVEDIYSAYGVKLAGRDLDEFALSPLSKPGHANAGYGTPVRGSLHGYEVVIERYMRPNADFPDGRLTIVAGDKVVFDGQLPYFNGDGGKRTYPFVKQTCMPLAGGFFGTCVVDRLIPVQRAYNAVKNRKHEFLNRIAMGVLAVEDGSVDTDELLDDGLMPGKILVYRQGGNPPEMLTLGSIPSEFTEEEKALRDEFSKISGTGDIVQNANVFTSVTSATGLQLIIEQDEARLNISYEQIKLALKKIGRHVLRLYKQFATQLRIMRVSDGEKSGVMYFKGSDIGSDDVVLEADSEINMTPAQRRNAIYEMLDRGMFDGENGKLPVGVRSRLLRLMGYGTFSKARDMAELHRKRSGEENNLMKSGKETCAVKDYDDHAVHIEEHTAFLLTEQLDAEQEMRITAHLSEHKNKFSEVNNGQPNA